MTIQTQVIWAIPTPQETQDLVAAKGNELTAEGKEIGEPVISSDPELEQTTVLRIWIDRATAQEWIDFVQTYNPISAVILN
jgi:predicted regulator of amino acid metabolism with ACT domain